MLVIKDDVIWLKEEMILVKEVNRGLSQKWSNSKSPREKKHNLASGWRSKSTAKQTISSNDNEP